MLCMCHFLPQGPARANAWRERARQQLCVGVRGAMDRDPFCWARTTILHNPLVSSSSLSLAMPRAASIERCV
jgi:hypothetical protein